MDTGGGKAGVKSDINVTPLVDIVLVLLIIFIVITPAVSNAVRLPLARNSFKPEKEQGAKYLQLILPAKRDPKDGNKVIGVQGVTVDDPNAKGLVMSFDDEARRAQLVKFIKASTDYLADKRVFVKADADLPFKYVNQLFQICREGGADEASIVTSEDKSNEKK
jgi:biopolymer transport protein TolR